MAAIDATSTAVLFIECQNGLLGDDSVMRSIAAPARAVVPHMARLAQGARRAGATVVHLTFVPAGRNRSANRRSPLFSRLLDGLSDWSPDHPATQPIEEIGVGPDDLVLARHTGLSPTYGTETFKLLRNMGVTTVVVAGISVNVAIPAVCVQAVDEDFDVVVATDAIAGAPAEYVASVLQHSLAFVARLTTVDRLLADWGPSATTT